MYGIVNKAIEELVIENFGKASWEKIKKSSGIDVDFFLSNQSYDDQITFDLAGAISSETGMAISDVMITFGEYWVLKTGKEKYGSLMLAGGSNLKEFILNLPDFHSRILLIYPNLTPPEFRVTTNEQGALLLHYHSKREGLQEFVRGLLQGLCKMFETPAQIELIQSRLEGNDHEIFKIEI
jgi:hypothetical protein